MEIWRYGAETEKFNLLAYCLEFIACRFTLVVWVVWSLLAVGMVGSVVSAGSVGSVVRLIGSDFLTSIKKFFIFPNFFHNYLIFNAFQI